MRNILKRIVLPLIPVICACADYDLLNLGEPDSVKLNVKAVTDSSVTLVWSKSGDEDFAAYKLYYSRSETVDHNDSLADSLLFRIDTVKTVRNLIPGTRYHFRVLVTTGRGLFSASNEVDTVTLEDTLADSSGGLQLYAPVIIADSSVLLRWSGCRKPFDSYKIFVDTTWDVTFEDSLAGTRYDTSMIVTVPGTDKTYWYRVYARKDNGYVGRSNSVEVEIPDIGF